MSNCPQCSGDLVNLTGDYYADDGKGGVIRIRNMNMNRCEECGEDILSSEDARNVDRVVKHHVPDMICQPGKRVCIHGELYVRCNARSHHTSPDTMVCTRRIGHDGPHVACYGYRQYERAEYHNFAAWK